MKNLTCVILAGGMGTRISEKTIDIPKPMIEIANKPLLIYIIDHYKKFHVKKFIICMGYKHEIIKNYFVNFNQIANDLRISNNIVKPIQNRKLDADITFINTGLHTNTGGRIKKIEKYIEGEDFFCTYGDGLSDVNLKNLYSFHKKKKKLQP
jgi:glucose-1-phosphate cytidylyltransferase